MSSSPRLPEVPAGPPARFWQAAARIAAGAAIVTLARHSNAQFVAAGLLAAATAIAAQAEAQLHARRARSSDLAEVVIPALAVAAILVPAWPGRREPTALTAPGRRSSRPLFPAAPRGPGPVTAPAARRPPP